MANAKLMLKCSHCGRDYDVMYKDISSIDSARMEAAIICPHCKKTNTVKCAQAEAMTPQKAVEVAIKMICFHEGEAIERAVHGAIGAVTALERVGLLSTEDAANLYMDARKAGDEQRARTKQKVSRGKKKGRKR